MAARDRLAAMRAQQQQGGRDNSYPTQASSGGAPPRRTNPYAQQDDNRQYEMSDVRHDSSTRLTTPASMGGGGSDMAAFYSEIANIQDTLRTFNENVQRIGDLHSRSLDQMDDARTQRNAEQLEQMIDDTGALSRELKQRIKALERKGGSGRDGQVRKQQTALVKSKFVEAIQTYQGVEQQFRQKYKQRMERQYKIVKPDATPEEIREVVNDTSGGQIFSQALMNSNRYGESKAAYREVQARHEDIKRIEQTIAELAQLFNDMSIMVEQQEETINHIEDTTNVVEKDVEMGLQYTETAVKSAAGARRKRWICFWLFLILIVIIVIIVLIELHPWTAASSGSSKSSAATVTVTSAAAAATGR